MTDADATPIHIALGLTDSELGDIVEILGREPNRLELSRAGTTLIVSSHQMATVEQMCDRVVLINKGEKVLDGRVSVVFGTHTHIQTADEEVLEKGTAYITDLGMSGPYDSVIGQNKENIIQRFLTSMPQKFEVAKENVYLSGIIVDVDEKTGRAKSIARVRRGK